MKNLPAYYEVELTIITETLGTTPKSQSIYDQYIKTRAKGKETKDEFASPLSEEAVKAKETQAWTGFMMENDRPFVLDYYIRGYLKHWANQFKEIIGITNARSKLENMVFVLPRRIFFDSPIDDKPFERPLRAQTAQGPRISLVKSDQIKNRSRLKFQLHMPFGGVFTKKELQYILDAGIYQGIGQFRGGGFGRFIYKIKEIEPPSRQEMLSMIADNLDDLKAPESEVKIDDFASHSKTKKDEATVITESKKRGRPPKNETVQTSMNVIRGPLKSRMKRIK